MNRATNILFPLILDTLTNKPLLCETQSNLLKDLNLKLKQQGIKVQNLKKELENTVDVGTGLGILTVQDEEVRMPFLLKPTNEGWARKKNDDETSEELNNKKAPEPSTNQILNKAQTESLHKSMKRIPCRSRCYGRVHKRRRSRRSRRARRRRGH